MLNGKGYCFSDVMGVYRLHKGGVWSEVSINQQRLIEFKARLAIYEVEKSDDAATFILFQFAKAMSRIWMLKQWRMFVRIYQILNKHYGDFFTTRLMFNKIVLGKGLEWEKVFDIKPISQK